MSHVVRMTVLVNNSVQRRGLLAEHGFALWIEVGGRHLLLDTGQGAVLAHNARELNVRLQQTDAVVLSHGHYDHTGGLAAVLQAAPKASVYAHPAALLPKYTRRPDGTCRAIGIPPPSESAVAEHEDTCIWTKSSTGIASGIFVTGEIPRRTNYEDTGGPFFTDPDCREPDSLPDDQAMFFECRPGTVVALGCGHAGVVNTLQYVRGLTGGKPIYAVIGGMHLVTASPERLSRTVEDLRELDVQRLGPAHCTGPAAVVELWNAFPGRCFACPVGTSMEFMVA